MEFATAIEKRPTLNLQFCLLALCAKVDYIILYSFWNKDLISPYLSRGLGLYGLILREVRFPSYFRCQILNDLFTFHGPDPYGIPRPNHSAAPPHIDAVRLNYAGSA